MAIDDDVRKRRRDREREEEEDRQQLENQEARLGSRSSGIPVEKLDELIQRAEGLIDQLGNLYNMYLSGAEKLLPAERRRQLDQIMVTITYAGKPTPSMLFKSNGVVSKYNTYRERWDKMIRDLENGKIKRGTGVRKVS